MRLKKETESRDSKIEARCTKAQRRLIASKAQLYCGGNISEWLIYAATNFVPGKEDLIDDEKKTKKKGRK